jgi:hypothetical protein
VSLPTRLPFKLNISHLEFENNYGLIAKVWNLEPSCLVSLVGSSGGILSLCKLSNFFDNATR